ncbi:hypothetical protein CMI42_04500 [Candidatus Pacearchaeota archaeon]|nr:hypothetical protein [Candidatus Pacearchaeota archaeon]
MDEEYENRGTDEERLEVRKGLLSKLVDTLNRNSPGSDFKLCHISGPQNIILKHENDDFSGEIVDLRVHYDKDHYTCNEDISRDYKAEEDLRNGLFEFYRNLEGFEVYERFNIIEDSNGKYNKLYIGPGLPSATSRGAGPRPFNVNVKLKRDILFFRDDKPVSYRDLSNEERRERDNEFYEKWKASRGGENE